jgi:hypothetical protein
MTKKFFKDWHNKQSLTKSIHLSQFYSFIEKNKYFYTWDHALDLKTLKFEGEYIQINARVFYKCIDTLEHGSKIMQIKIHRKDIKTVKFKKL